ncbi:acyltransferase family protein [Pseudohoeflea coraliihabitans]|uniref:Acyltransferase n=1 Tax=Pseudohoeflea coraliihabitans TaxID=2860393 RepID=A0ABS6WS57_9HYPH|nr:acyltransferase [Pseudohoeflea sp. DP4N28-3]MBW3098798.1 acyltransferase [Pseudohoeflea sp. DP4N28-3]
MSPTKINPVEKRIDAIQYLRGFAALAVFLFHVSTLTVAAWGESAAGIDHVGAAGVDLFFVISGYVMAMIVARPVPQAPAEFAVRRVARVVPGYWVATLGVFAVALFLPHFLDNTTADIATLLHSLLFIPWPDHQGSLTPILLIGWTLNYEIFFYILVALTVWGGGDRRLLTTTGVLVALVLSGWLMQPQHPTLAFYTDPILLEFAFGILVYRCSALLQDGNGRMIATAIGLGAITFLLLLHERDAGDYRTFLWGVPCALILFAALRAVRFYSPSLVLLGDWSYSLYLTHLFVIAFYIRFVMPNTPAISLIWVYHYAAIATCSLCAAGIFHRYVEVPANRWLLKSFGYGARRPGPSPSEDGGTVAA